MKKQNQTFEVLIFILLTLLCLLNRDPVSWGLYGVYLFVTVIKWASKKNMDLLTDLSALSLISYQALSSGNQIEYLLLIALVAAAVMKWSSILRKKPR